MITESIKFRGHRCFKEVYSGFDEIRPVNVIIGRNNSGKSNLIDLVEEVCAGGFRKAGWEYQCRARLRESDLRNTFSDRTSGGTLGGNHWGEHGHLFIDREVVWELNCNGLVTRFEFLDGFDIRSRHGDASTAARKNLIQQMLAKPGHSLNGKAFRRLLADRDIRSEDADTSLNLQSDGSGATNIIRRFITSSSPSFPREVIQSELLQSLNEIFGNDGRFTEIEVQFHDEPAGGGRHGHWEVYLGEANKGLVSLSNSGSGLKTVILVLLNLLVVPRVNGAARESFAFAFEELENNLHPALLRRLLRFVEVYAVRENIPVFLTTHSSVALDLFSISPHAQILHVSHDGHKAQSTKLKAHFDQLSVISELGAKPSDLLQANCVIWVEGPSDCIYIKRWLELFTHNELREGRDYQIAFFGGSLLARTQFKSPSEAEDNLVNLIHVNPHVIVVCDSDRSRPGAPLKDRVQRISREITEVPRAHVWITKAREIENYLPASVLEKAFELTHLPDLGQYEAFFPRKGNPGQSYVEKHINRNSLDKVELAALCAPFMTREVMATRFDWSLQMELLSERIQEWNR